MRMLPNKDFSKYKAVRVVTMDGLKFDSTGEYHRWLYLKDLEKGGEIKDLRRQVPYVLLPSQKDEEGNVLFREVKYVADFVYTDCKTGKEIVEDFKGIILPDFKLKQKMMYFFHHIEVKIVKR